MSAPSELQQGPYCSFLICDHGEFQNVYVNGLPIGRVSMDRFEPHHHVMPNGDRIPVPTPRLAGFQIAMLAIHAHQTMA
jgi:hypothetical protein